MQIEVWPKQAEFLDYAINRPLRHVVHVGGFGSGKTHAAAIATWLLALGRPRSRGIVAAGTYRQMKDTMLDAFDSIGEEHHLDRHISRWSKSDMTLTLRNGTEILFRSMEAMRRILSINASWYWADQAESLTAEQFRALDTRVRKGTKGIGLLTANSAYGKWFETFYSKLGRPDDLPLAPLNAFGQLQLGPKKSTGLIMRSSTLDNYSNPPEYAANLIEQYGGEESPYTRRLIYGEDIPFGGVIYSMFRPAVHVVEPFPIPDSWEKWGALDFGYEHPFVYLLFAEDPQDGMIYVVAEYRKRRTLLAEHARAMRRIESQYPYRVGNALQELSRFCDHDAQDRNELLAAGLGMQNAVKDVREGILTVIRALSIRANGQPGVKIFSTCTQLLQEIREYRWDEKARGETPYKGPTGQGDDGVICDDTMDAFRYGLHSRIAGANMRVVVDLDLGRKPFGAGYHAR